MTEAQIEIINGLSAKADGTIVVGATDDELYSIAYGTDVGSVKSCVAAEGDEYTCGTVLFFDSLSKLNKQVFSCRYLIVKDTEQNRKDIVPFTRKNRKWSVVLAVEGLLVLSQFEEDKAPLPSKFRIAVNYAKTKVGEAIHGRKLVPLEIAEFRLENCDTCVLRNEDRCGGCGCYLTKIPDDSPVDAGEPGKVYRADQSCPINLWSAYLD